MHRLIPVQLNDPTNPIRCEFFIVEPPETRMGNVLIMKFSGVYRVGCKGNPDASFMSAMRLAALEHWDPGGTVLDLSDLQYDWGDMMDLVRGPGGGRWREHPHAVVVGPKSRRAMATLMFGVDTTKPATDAEGHFDGDLDAAITYVIERLPRFTTETLHLHPPANFMMEPAERALGPMSEQRWLTSQNPATLLRWAAWRVPPPPTYDELRAQGMSDEQILDPRREPQTDDWSTITPDIERRMLLFSVACLRRTFPVMDDARSRALVETAERLADGAATFAERDAAREAAQAAHHDYFEEACEVGYVRGDGENPEQAAAGKEIWHRPATAAAWAALYFDQPDRAADAALDAFPPNKRDAERKLQADLLRDIFGNPFRPPLTLDQRYRTGEIVRLARAIYDERAFDRLGELAAALARRGCTDESILAHLRHPGPHARGCHVLDVILQ